MYEAVLIIARAERADRIGVWLERDSRARAEPQAPAILRGILWETDASAIPRDWEKLSLEPPLPLDLLASGKSAEQELGAMPDVALIGPLAGLRQALWTPIHQKGRLRGIILSGAAKKRRALPRELAESVAAELALALGLTDEQQAAREHDRDLAASKQVLAALGTGASADTILSQLVAECTEASPDGSALGAAFALIGHFPASSVSESREMDFAWESGDPAWTGSVERDPLRSLWHKALEAGHVVGMEPPSSCSQNRIERLLAIPLATRCEALGVLLAGLASNSASLHALERLEMRAALAVSALEHRRQSTERTRRFGRRQSLLELSSEPTVLLDASGAIVNLNRSAKALLEEKPAERAREPLKADALDPAASDSAWCIGGRLPQLFCAREQMRVEEWTRGALLADRPMPAHQTIPLPSACDAELVTGVRVRLRAPIAVGDDLAAVLLDPSAAHEAAAQRSRSEAELHNVLEWVEEGILLFAANNSIRALNTRFAQIAGLSAEEAAACTNLDSLIACLAERAAEPEMFAKGWRELAGVSEGGHREEVQMARPIPRVLERSVRPVLDHMGRRLGRLEIYRDLSAHRVFQARLLQTEKLAALGQLVTGVAHELSSPLTSILGYSQRLLVRKDLAGRTQEARQIYQEAERASAMLRQLLLTARESRPECKKVSLNQIVLRAMELQRFASAAEKTCIELDLDPTLPFVLGDAGQLQQVLMNLIGNARQAIVQEGRGGTIQLRTARSGERRVVLEVADDGPGIPPTVLPRIFDPFFTTKPPDVGTGLGLSIVLSVVREHGGQVNVSSPPGSGARFSIELPVAAEASNEPSRRVASANHQTSKAATGAGSHAGSLHALPSRAKHREARVLVLEDEPTVARLIADVLEDEGLHVDVLLDAREALEHAAREPYDLFICDMKMPGLDGQHFFQSLANTHSPLQDRFLFVTGDIIASQTQEFLERHQVSHLAKPFRVEELTEKVFSLLESHLPHKARAVAAKKAR
ncbi:MAG TPA: ATP-binding protein [Candidatus Methylomirabilis sp.]|nr:ATP-binding protein [Candidatus Methylomirabilis sp.]